MVAMLCGWLQREQQDVIAFLRAENRVLKARLEGKRLRLNDSERQRLAELGHRLGRRLLGDIATIVTPDTILRWHRIQTTPLVQAFRGLAGDKDILRAGRFLICDRDPKWRGRWRSCCGRLAFA